MALSVASNRSLPGVPAARRKPCSSSVARTTPAVVLAESVRLARRYGSERSPGFVNGVAEALARRLRPAPAAEADG